MCQPCPRERVLQSLKGRKTRLDLPEFAIHAGFAALPHDFIPARCDISRMTDFHVAWARSPVAVNTALNSFICAQVSRASSFFPSLVLAELLR